MNMNFWSYIINGAASIITWLVYGQFPTHTQMGLVQTTADITSSALTVTFLIVFSNIDMTVPLLIFGVICALELVRGIYAAWRWVKRIFI